MRHKLLKLVPVYALAVLCLVWVFHGTDLNQLQHRLAAVSWPYLALSAMLNVAVYFANAWRWKVALLPIGRVPFRRSLKATYIGVFLNEALPLRPGEIARSALLSRWSPGLGFATVVSSTLLERLSEAAWLEVGFLAVIATVKLPKSVVYAFAVLSAMLVVGCAFVAFVGRRAQHHDGSLPEGRLARHWRQFVTGLHLLGRFPTISAVAGLSLLSLFLNVLATWALMATCGIALSLGIAAAVFMIIRIGTAVPSTPGSIGPYQLFCVLSLGLFGVGKTAAVTFSLATLAAVTVPLLAGGAVAFVRAGEDFSDVVALTSRAALRDSQS